MTLYARSNNTQKNMVRTLYRASLPNMIYITSVSILILLAMHFLCRPKLHHTALGECLRKSLLCRDDGQTIEYLWSNWVKPGGVTLGHNNNYIHGRKYQQHPPTANENERQSSAQGVSYTHAIHVNACAVLLLVGWSINFYTTRGRLPAC